ncbi:MAG: SUF system NifU family Fe-S cluster assembly protein [Chloroflexi bacterium]|nr:SUF system NifU family Fe-S cluster assembly protein [Chloroflexota bacterium]
MLEELYRDVILAHYRSPEHRGAIQEPDVSGYAHHPLCGDELSVAARVRGDRIVDAAFEARGCSIVHASADMMSDAVRGKTMTEAATLAERFQAMMLDSGDDQFEDLGDLAVFQVVRRYPVRVRCALLPWTTLVEAFDSYREDRTGDNGR